MKSHPFLPTTFAVASVGRAFDIQLGKMLQNGSEGSTSKEVPYFKSKHVQWAGVECNDLPRMWASASERLKYAVVDGDLLVCEGGDVGRAAIVRAPPPGAILQNALHRVRAKGGDIRFLNYVLRATQAAGWFEVLCNRATIAHFTVEKLSKLPIPLPPLATQNAISNFLDGKLAAIDTLIDKKEELLSLLTAKQGSLTHSAVTKGLDSGVPMRDSGVRWVGPIPAHWQMQPLRGLLQERGVYNRGPRTTNILSVMKDIGVVPYDERGTSGNKKSLNIEQYKVIHPGDVVINRMNAIFGSLGLSRYLGAASIEYYVLKAAHPDVNTDFYARMFSTRAFQQSLVGVGRGILAHRMRIPFVNLKQVMLPKPPLREQLEIVQYLDSQAVKLGQAAALILEQIKKLREYRQALITAAVTGQLDIGGAAS